MEPSYKVCPHCGQRAVLHMVQCGRCGFSYAPVAAPPNPYPTPAKPLSDRAAAEFGKAPVPLAPTRNSAFPLVFLIGVLLLLVGGSWMLSRKTRTQPTERDPFAQASRRRSVPTTPRFAPRDGGMTTRRAADTPISGNPFTERTTQTEMPTINITGTSVTDDTVVFRSANGQTYQMVVSMGRTSSLQIPAGDYGFRLVPGDPDIRGQYGDATFRRFRAYDLYITSTADGYSRPGHIGDE